MVKNYIKKWRRKNFSCFVWGFTDCSVLGRLLAWQWRVHDQSDVMNIMSVCNIKLKWNRRVTEKAEEMVGGGGGRKEREREHAELWNMDSWEKKKKKKKLVLDPTLEKEEGFQFQTSTGMNARMGKPEYPGGKNISHMQCKPYDITLDEGFTAIKTQKNKKERKERNSHIHSHTIIHVYICTNAVWFGCIA